MAYLEEKVKFPGLMIPAMIRTIMPETASVHISFRLLKKRNHPGQKQGYEGPDIWQEWQMPI